MAEEQKWISSHFHLPLKLSESSELPSTMSAVIGTPGLVDCSIMSICTSTCPKKQTNKAKTRSLSASKHSQTSTHSSNCWQLKRSTTAPQQIAALPRMPRHSAGSIGWTILLTSSLCSVPDDPLGSSYTESPTVLNNWESSFSLMCSGTKHSIN